MAARFHKGGRFANEGERRVVDALTKALPPNAHVISNLYLPNRNDTLEIDVVVATALGVAVVEVKDWRGLVRFSDVGCDVDGEPRQDPRNGISLKAKILYSRLSFVHANTSPIVIFASDATNLVMTDSREHVPVRRLADAVSFIRSGGLFAHRARGTLSDRELARVVDDLVGGHDDSHRVRLGQYALGAPTGLAKDDELWGYEQTAAATKVRLRRHVIDEFASPKERDSERRAAQRAFEALRKLQEKRLRALPMMYTTFPDPDDDATIWTAYEGVDGPSLLNAELSAKDKVAALALVAENLASCHDAGVVHRGISPKCLIVPKGSSTPVILNFDFAKLHGAETIGSGRPGMDLRNQTRLAPEVRRGGAGTPVADIFALGVSAIEILSGSSVKSVEEARAAAKRLRPRELVPIVLRMVEDQPGQRFPNMKDVSAALRKAVRA